MQVQVIVTNETFRLTSATWPTVMITCQYDALCEPLLAIMGNDYTTSCVHIERIPNSLTWAQGSNRCVAAQDLYQKGKHEKNT